MKIEFPTKFEIFFPKRNKKYYNNNNRAEIKNLLTAASSNYCMYCGNKVVINNKNYGQIEHSVDKVQNKVEISYLKHCKRNMALACPICNTSLKKITRSIYIYDGRECSNECDEICSRYAKNREDYIRANQMLLMPQGKYSNIDGELLCIEYDLLRLTFETAEGKNYSEEEVSLIENHISRFALNSERYMPLDILELCEFIIEYKNIPKEGMFNNYLADLFIKELNQFNLTIEQTIKLCEIILIMSMI